MSYESALESHGEGIALVLVPQSELGDGVCDLCLLAYSWMNKGMYDDDVFMTKMVHICFP